MLEVEVKLRVNRGRRNENFVLLKTFYLYNQEELNAFSRSAREELAKIRNGILQSRT